MLTLKTAAMKSREVGLGLAFAALLLPSTGTAQQPGCLIETKQNIGQNDLKSVVVNDLDVLQRSGIDFSLARTLGNILSTAAGPQADTPANRVELLRSMLRSLNEKSFLNPVSGQQIPVQPRPGEAALADIADRLLKPGDPEEMRPVGVFNRLDLAPLNWKYCGEHRIVYAKGAPNSPTDRLTLIFEAAVSNPDKNNFSSRACRPIAAFWKALRAQSGAALARSLEQFYYTGLPGFQPVIHFEHFGMPFGQVRGNLFVKEPKFIWQLREWHIAIPANAKLPSFMPAPLGNNPQLMLYSPDKPGDDALVHKLRQDFQAHFIEKSVPALLKVETDALAKGQTATNHQLFAGLGTEDNIRFNAFESNANLPPDGRGDAPNTHVQANDDMTRRIGEIIAKSGLPESCRPTPEQLLERAGVTSCGGCHDFSKSRAISQNQIVWPQPVLPGFVHIDEKGDLSPLLKDSLLPSRLANLNSFLSQPTALSAIASDLPERLAIFRAERRNAITFMDTDRTALQALVQKLRAEDRATPGAFSSFRSSD